MNKKTKVVIGALVVWGVSNNIAAYIGAHHFQEACDILQKQVDTLMEIGTRLAGELTAEQLNSALRHAPFDAEFDARLNNM